MTQIKGVAPHTLKEWLDAGRAILVDVRDPQEYEEVRIPGSVLMPVEVCGHLTLPHNPDKAIVLHCHKGVRGERACAACVEHLPHRRIYNLEGGIEAWIDAGLPVERGIDPGHL